MSGTIGRRSVMYWMVVFYILAGVCLLAARTEAAIGDITEETCRGCHTTAVPNHHRLAFNCQECHKTVPAATGGFTLLNFRDCLQCHTPTVHLMSCTLCHTDKHFADYVGKGMEMHSLHRDKVVCGVCHKIPTTIALGPPEAACGNLCHEPRKIVSAKEIHQIHSLSSGIVTRGCYWCHGQNVPKRARNSCDLCHSGVFGDAQKAHQEHARQVECSVCHQAVVGFYDVRTVSRDYVCSKCHEPRQGCNFTVHFVHVPDKAQCYACHGKSNVYASSRGRLDCTICHDATLNPRRQATFDEVHRRHAARGMMCAACHQIPPSANGASW